MNIRYPIYEGVYRILTSGPTEAYLAAQSLEIISATLLRVRSHEARQ